jgi:hypothetical protein
MCISTIHGLQRYLVKNSGFSSKLINDVVVAIGYNPLLSKETEIKNLSAIFVDCVKNGANNGIKGFSCSTELFQFFQKHRREIGIHLRLDAAGKVTDLFSMVQDFKFFKNANKPWALDIEEALWGDINSCSELTELYSVFSWYALEEVSKTWYRYLEENPRDWAKIAA